MATSSNSTIIQNSPEEVEIQSQITENEINSIPIRQSSKKAGKTYHPLLRPFIDFWNFSSYYAEYKARTRGQ